jgi:Chaperone of endosialidase
MAGETPVPLGSLSNPRTYLLDTDELVYADMAADATGATGGNIVASALVKKDATGNVAIGIASAASKLHVSGGTGNINTTFDTPSAGDTRNEFRNNGARAGYQYWDTLEVRYFTDSTRITTFYGNNLERLRIDSGGNIAAGADNAQTMGTAPKRWSVIYAGTGTINTSDAREKTDIGEIPEAWLDAWGEVKWSRFKMIDGKRWHTGLVAQQVHAAFAAQDLDAFEMGLCCFDEWEEERATTYDEIDGEMVDTGKTRVTLEPGDRWGLRYEECQAIEAAWQRRELARMAARIAELESQ